MKELRVPIVGARFRPPAAWVLGQLGAGRPLVLRREASNPYDTNAIAVELPGPWADVLETGEDLEEQCADQGVPVPSTQDALHLGYVPKEIAAHWAPVFDEAGAVPPTKFGFNEAGRPEAVIEVEEGSGGNDTSAGGDGGAQF